MTQAQDHLPVLDPSRAPNGVYLVDTFHVPEAARTEFEAAMQRNRAFLHTLPGFRGDVVLFQTQGSAFDIVTVAAWDNADAIARAKDDVGAYYRKIGFDMAASIARWGVRMERSICEAPARFRSRP